MTIDKYILSFFIALSLFSCNREAQLGNESLSDQRMLYPIIDSLIENTDSLVDMFGMDTTYFFTTEDYFFNKNHKNRLVITKGYFTAEQGGDYLILLFSDHDKHEVVWYETVGQTDLSALKDINYDQIKEIVIQKSYFSTTKRTCNDLFEIINFVGGKKNVLFSSLSSTVINCMFDEESHDSINTYYSKGDTIEKSRNCTLIDEGNQGYMIQEIRRLKIHNGGDIDSIIAENAIVIQDTIITRLP